MPAAEIFGSHAAQVFDAPADDAMPQGTAFGGVAESLFCADKGTETAKRMALPAKRNAALYFARSTSRRGRW